MDGLFGLLITIGILALSSNRKKKKAQQKQQARKRIAREVQESLESAKLPFSKEGWDALLSNAPQAQPKMSEARRVVPIGIVPDPEHDEPEGTVSTQGESAAEHEQHRLKVLLEEQKQAQEHEALQQMRGMNLQKLRSAVVMSEVLGKPVSLRPRGDR